MESLVSGMVLFGSVSVFTGTLSPTLLVVVSVTVTVVDSPTPRAGTFTVYTIDGKEVAQYTVSASVNMVTLPSNLAAGIYMSRFMGADGTSTVVRLVYEHK